MVVKSKNVGANLM